MKTLIILISTSIALLSIISYELNNRCELRGLQGQWTKDILHIQKTKKFNWKFKEIKVYILDSELKETLNGLQLTKTIKKETTSKYNLRIEIFPGVTLPKKQEVIFQYIITESKNNNLSAEFSRKYNFYKKKEKDWICFPFN